MFGVEEINDKLRLVLSKDQNWCPREQNCELILSLLLSCLSWIWEIRSLWNKCCDFSLIGHCIRDDKWVGIWIWNVASNCDLEMTANFEQRPIWRGVGGGSVNSKGENSYYSNSKQIFCTLWIRMDVLIHVVIPPGYAAVWSRLVSEYRGWHSSLYFSCALISAATTKSQRSSEWAGREFQNFWLVG